MLYHVSPTPGLKVLRPHVSSHHRAYVYATEHLVTGLLFGVRKDDFDFRISTDERGISTVSECYPGAFQRVYQGKSCSAYVVDDEGFQRGMTSWSEEVVRESDTPVKEEIVIPDLYQRLLEEEERGALVIHRYAFDPAYRAEIAAHVVDRLIRFDVNLHQICDQDERFRTHYKGLVDGLLSLMDGHLLQ